MNNMKNTLLNYFITIIVVIAIVELTNFAFTLMNQPDTYVFYLGLLIILSEGFAGGWLVMRTLKNIFSPKEDNSEKNKPNKKKIDNNYLLKKRYGREFFIVW